MGNTQVLTSTTALPDATAWSVVPFDDDALLLIAPGVQEPQTPNWREELCTGLRTLHHMGAVGVKRLDNTGAIWSMGEIVVHPKGFHSVGRTLPAESLQFPVEVDAVTGGVVCVRRQAIDAAGGADAIGTSVDLLRCCLRMRLAGWNIATLPNVAMTDAAELDPSDGDEAAFVAEFGFDWRAADLDLVRELHAGTGLLWNVRFHAGDVRYTKYESRPLLHWQMYTETPAYRSRMDGLVQFIHQNAPTGRILDFGCGDALPAHLLAMKGLEVVGLDREPSAIDQARKATASQTYPGAMPVFVCGREVDAVRAQAPFETVVMLDVIEHLRNPARLLQSLGEIMTPNGQLVVITPEWQHGRWSDPEHHVCEYTHQQLLGQLNACGFAEETSGRIGEPYRDLIVVTRRK